MPVLIGILSFKQLQKDWQSLKRVYEICS